MENEMERGKDFALIYFVSINRIFYRVIWKAELFDSFAKVHYDLPPILRQRYSKQGTLGCFTGLLAW